MRQKIVLTSAWKSADYRRKIAIGNNRLFKIQLQSQVGVLRRSRNPRLFSSFNRINSIRNRFDSSFFAVTAELNGLELGLSSKLFSPYWTAMFSVTLPQTRFDKTSSWSWATSKRDFQEFQFNVMTSASYSLAYNLNPSGIKKFQPLVLRRK